MVGFVSFYPGATTGRDYQPTQEEPTLFDTKPRLSAKGEALRDKHDIRGYVLKNLPIFVCAGAATGAQEAFYAFQRMPASVSRNTLLQATTLMSIVGRKTVYASVLGALFTFTEAFLENTRGHDTYNGIAAGAVTGAFFGLVPMRPMPQPIAWPLAFAAAAGVADIFGEFFPATMQTTRSYGPLETRPGWGDPAPPRPPIVSSGVPPNSRGHFTQGE